MNCPDYDLCSTCEASQSRPHPKTHVFCKVKIPIPTLAQPHKMLDLWYPGDNMRYWPSLDAGVRERLAQETGLEDVQIEAYYDQFSCIANVHWPQDPCGLNAAVDRRAFNKAMSSDNWPHPVEANFLYERMFNFYDTNGDELIGLSEFVDGLAYLNQSSKPKSLAREIRGFDVDGDGFVSRKDFIRMLSAKYGIHRIIVQDMIAAEQAEMHRNTTDIVTSSQPISAAFGQEDVPMGETRTPSGKSPDEFGEMQLSGNSVEQNVVLPDDLTAFNPGYEIPEAEQDYGNEVLWQTIQAGFNEMLDPLFKPKEELARQVAETREERRKRRKEIDRFVEEQKVFKEELMNGSEIDPLLATAMSSYNALDPQETEESIFMTPADPDPPTPAPDVNQADIATEIRTRIQSAEEALPTDEASLEILEAEIRNQPLDQLLEASGYSIAEEQDENEVQPLEILHPRVEALRTHGGEFGAATALLSFDEVVDTQNNATPEAEETSLAASEGIPAPDPTMPQNRPDAGYGPLQIAASPEPNGHSGSPSPTRSWSTVSSPIGVSLTLQRSPSRSPSAMRLSPSSPPTPPPASTQSPPPPPPPPPSATRLELLARLDVEERQIMERGGPGRMSYDEVEAAAREARRKGDRSIWGLVEGWLEWAAF